MTLRDLSRELNMFLSKTPNFENKEVLSVILLDDDNITSIHLNDENHELIRIKGGELLSVKVLDEEGAGE